MMRFERVKSSLERYCSKENITIGEALGIFSDLCEDIRQDTGKTIENNPAGELELFASMLGRGGRTFHRIFQNQKQLFGGQDVEAMIGNMDKKLVEDQAEMESLSAKIQGYRNMLEEERARSGQLEALRAECAKLENETEKLGSGKLQKLFEEKAALQQKKEKLEEQIRQEKENLDAAGREQKELLEQQRAILEQKRQRMREQAAERDALDREQRKEEKILKELTAETGRMRKEKQDRDRALEAVKTQRNVLDGELVFLQDETERLKKYLEGLDVAQLRKERERLELEKQQKNQIYEAERRGLEQTRSELQEKNDQLAGVRDRLEKIRSSLLDENERTESRNSFLEHEIELEEEKKRSLGEKTEMLEERNRELVKWFQGLEAEAYASRLASAEKRAQYFAMVQRALLGSGQELKTGQWLNNESMNEKREEFQYRMREIEEMLREYRRQYEIVLGCLSE